jgi:hypothetical protein
VDALRAAAPPWCDEQLWCGQLVRARRKHATAPPFPWRPSPAEPA